MHNFFVSFFKEAHRSFLQWKRVLAGTHCLPPVQSMSCKPLNIAFHTVYAGVYVPFQQDLHLNGEISDKVCSLSWRRPCLRPHTHLHCLIIPQIQHTDPPAQSQIPHFLKKSARTSVPLKFQIFQHLSIHILDTMFTSGSCPNCPSQPPITLTSLNCTTSSPHNHSPHLLLHSWL
jgi:hypothetical protein